MVPVLRAGRSGCLVGHVERPGKSGPTSRMTRSSRWAPSRTTGTAVALNQIVKDRDGFYYAFYHANSERPWKDWTTCVARSRDLVHWEKYPGNPIIRNNCSSAILVRTPQGQDRLYTMHPDVKVFVPSVGGSIGIGWMARYSRIQGPRDIIKSMATSELTMLILACSAYRRRASPGPIHSSFRGKSPATEGRWSACRPEGAAMPRPDTGPIPRVGNGQVPRAGTGPMPRGDTGLMPRNGTGPMPRAGTGPVPRANSGPMPRLGTGPMPRLEGAAMPRPDTDSIAAGRQWPGAAQWHRPDAACEGTGTHAAC